MFSNGTFKEFTKYDENEEGVEPIGVVYADVYLDPSVTPTNIPTSSPSYNNVKPFEAEDGIHRIYACVFNDKTAQWTNGQNNAEDVLTINNNTDASRSYNTYTWNEDTATLDNTSYMGELFTEALEEWIGEDGGSIHKDKYDALQFIKDYNVVSSGDKVSLNGNIHKFFPDITDLWDQFTMKYLIQQVINKVIEVNSDRTSGTTQSNGSNSGNCYSMRDGTYYWSSSEYSATVARVCYTSSASSNTNDKWNSYYVRPSLAFHA